MRNTLCAHCQKPLAGRSQFKYCSRDCSNTAGRKPRPVLVDGDIARILLPDGSVAVVDVADLPLVRDHAWSRNPDGYATCSTSTPRENGVRRGGRLMMHRVIAETPEGFATDHVDGDTLNNRRSNLRPATTLQNGQHKRKRAKAASKYKGVRLHWDGRWAAAIGVNYRRIHLGYFANEIDAARAYDTAAREHHGEFAVLNFSTREGAA